MKNNMKVILAIVGLSLAISLDAQIQIGTKASVLYSTAKINGIADNVLDKSLQDAFDVSLFASIPLAKNFYLQPEIGYNKKGFEVGQSIDLNLFNVDLPIGVAAVTEIDYIQVPVLGRLQFEYEKGGVYFLAGPSIAYATKGQLRTKVSAIIDLNLTRTDLDMSNSDYNRFEFAGVLGTGAFLNIGTNAKAFTEFKYHHGMSNLLDDPIVDLEIKNRAFGIGAGFQIGF